MERIQDYVSIEQEPKPRPDGVPPAYWPSSGKLAVEGLSARYSVVSLSPISPTEKLVVYDHIRVVRAFYMTSSST